MWSEGRVGGRTGIVGIFKGGGVKAVASEAESVYVGGGSSTGYELQAGGRRPIYLFYFILFYFENLKTTSILPRHTGAPSPRDTLLAPVRTRPITCLDSLL